MALFGCGVVGGNNGLSGAELVLQQLGNAHTGIVTLGRVIHPESEVGEEVALDVIFKRGVECIGGLQVAQVSLLVVEPAFESERQIGFFAHFHSVAEVRRKNGGVDWAETVADER